MEPRRRAGTFGLVVALVAAVAGARAQTVDARGAAMLAALLLPLKAEIERLSGQTLHVAASSTARGLSALAAGSADIALLAESLDEALATARLVAPGSLDARKLEGFRVAGAALQIVVHASNPVDRLDDRQIADLFSGRIANWTALGGPDLAVVVYTEPTCAPHQVIQRHFGFAMSPSARPVAHAAEIAPAVARQPGAIGYLSTAHASADGARVKAVATGTRVPLELHVAIRRDAPAGVRRVVEAVRQIAHAQ